MQVELLIPQLTLLLGVFGVIGLHMWGDPQDKDSYWRVQSFVLLLALAQQMLLYRVGSSVFMVGGMTIDGLTQALNIAVLILASIVHWCRRTETREHTPQAQVLFLITVFFCTVFIQTNRFLFGVLALVGVATTALNALGAEAALKAQQRVFKGSLLQGLWILLLGTLLVLFSYFTFGDISLDEMRRLMARPQQSGYTIPTIHYLVLLMGYWFLAVPPLAGLWMGSRNRSTWSLTLATTGLMMLVSAAIFLRWGIWIFSRPAMGGNMLEPLGNVDIFISLRVLAAIGLLATPLCANLTSNFRQGVLMMLTTPLLQSLFAFSFGQKVCFGFALGLIATLPFIVGLLVVAISFLDLPEDFEVKQWMGLGRQNLAATSAIILALGCCAGFGPFFGSLLVENTLRLNQVEVGLLVLNLLLSGLYIGRLLALAFQKPRWADFKVTELSLIDYLGQGTLLLLLFFVGIFWEPLYKYGAFSIRYFFGDI